MTPITIDRRFCGPPNSGNGGYVCGLLGRHVGHSAEVTLQRPPPLDTPLEIRMDGKGAASLHDGDTVLAVARPVAGEIDASPYVPFADAREAARRPFIPMSEHALPNCFVCGPGRASGDGMRLFAGSVDGVDGLLAAPWIPDENLPHENGSPREEILWAALDCPSGYAAYTTGAPFMLLGRMTARVTALPKLDENCVVTATVADRDGRKIMTDCALYGDGGRLLAASRNTWIMVSREVQMGTQ